MKLKVWTSRGVVAVVLSALLALTTTARADGYVVPPPLPTTTFGVNAPGALDTRFLGEYRAPHLAQIAPKRARGRALLGTGIASAAVGFLTMIIGGALAVQTRYTYTSSYDDSNYTHPYQPSGYYAVGAGAGLLLVGGALITLGAIPLTEASSHEHAIGGLVVGFAR